MIWRLESERLKNRRKIVAPSAECNLVMWSPKDVGILVATLRETENQDFRGLTAKSHGIINDAPSATIERRFTPGHLAAAEAPPTVDPSMARQQSAHGRHYWRCRSGHR